MINKRASWLSLISLTLIHFFVDLFPGMIGAILPAVRMHFTLSLKTAVAAASVLHITCNMVQVFTGHLRKDKTKPLFIYIGVSLASLLCLLGFLPQFGIFYTLCGLMLITGTGIALTHPEALRAVHEIKGISASLATSIFMMGGFCGFASGGYICSSIVEKGGLQALSILLVVPVFAAMIVAKSGIKLAIEKPSVAKEGVEVPFWTVLVAALPYTTAVVLLTMLLPSKLNEIGFTLSQGGIATLMFGIGSAFGSVLWALVAKRLGDIKTVILCLLSGIVFLWYYLANIEANYVMLLLIAGFTTGASFPFMVTLARRARGFCIGQRMGFIVGGAWGVGSIVLAVMGKVAEAKGIMFVLEFVPLLFLISAVMHIAIAVVYRGARQVYD